MADLGADAAHPYSGGRFRGSPRRNAPVPAQDKEGKICRGSPGHAGGALRDYSRGSTMADEIAGDKV